jgi:cAMP-binding proteins - catabolite gene activator and regulatory subunit of cAMP-dependent protein kinases
METSEAILQKLPYWEKLTDEEKSLLAANCTVRQYQKGEIVHGGNYECPGQIFVLSGEIRTYLLSEEGREVTLFMLREGDPCVLSASCILSQITFETQMKAMKTTDLLIIHLGAFQRIIKQNIYVRCFMFELATERFSQVMWSMQQILFMGFDRRLASYLLGEYERTGSKYIRMTHEQIAEQVSSAREVVARMLKRFAADGLIEAERGTIRLINIDELRQLI